MENVRRLFKGVLWMGMLMGLALPLPASAQMYGERVRVIMPDGHVIYVRNSRDMPWYRRQEFTRYRYTNYVYSPSRHGYIVSAPGHMRYRRYQERRDYYCPHNDRRCRPHHRMY